MQDSLYRFRPLNTHTIDELKKSYLYFSTIDGLNDPMEHFYLLFFDENEKFYKNLFKHFLAVMHIVSLDSKLNGKEVFKKDLARQVFEFDKDIEIFRNVNLDRWIDEHCQDIISSLANSQIWENEIKEHLIKIYKKYYCKDSNDNARKYAESRVIEYLAQIRKFAISEVVVCCFRQSESANGRDCHLSNDEILMWAHYASGHSGICVEFSNIVESNTNFGEIIKPKPITYESSKDYIIKNLQFSVGLTLTNNDIDLPQRIVVKDIKNLYNTKYQYIFNTKLDAWCGENEYRITMLKSDLPKQKLKYDFNCLKSITFGVRTPQDKVDEIIKIIKQQHKGRHNHSVEFYKVNIKNGKFVREFYREQR